MTLRQHLIKVLILATLVIAIVVVGSSIVKRETADRRSPIGRMVRSWKGEYYVRQMANDLAEDFRRIPALARLQPWALETIARCRAGQIQGDRGSYFYWANDVLTLRPEETPEFIQTCWGRTNKFGEVRPLISIVMSNGQAEYIVLYFGEYGVVVGPPEFLLPFGPQWTNHVAPGVYTYSIEQ